ncbi:MAG TPA: NAD(P)-binding domain-containing protein [Desulfosporosinus sp.]|nr:NAD(P)-binding domain-containing protein [Desulfosporosinus sp.]
MRRIGFIGLGTMGLPMAKRLLKAGYQLSIYNRSLGKTKELESLGAQVAASPEDVARESQVVFTMLAADQAVEEVIFGPRGIAIGAATGMIVIDCSTISPTTSKRIAEQLKSAGVEMLDAPVTGSEPHAIEGTLAFLVGGNRDVFASCEPLFNILGQKASYLGGNGSGTYAKLAHNAMAAMNLLSLAEGMIMVTKAGIDPELFVQAIGAGGANSKMMEMKTPKILDRDFRAHFAIKLMQKDLRLALLLADELKIPVPVLSTVKEMLQISITQGHEDEDICSVIKTYEEWSGIEVKKLVAIE